MSISNREDANKYYQLIKYCIENKVKYKGPEDVQNEIKEHGNPIISEIKIRNTEKQDINNYLMLQNYLRSIIIKKKDIDEALYNFIKNYKDLEKKELNYLIKKFNSTNFKIIHNSITSVDLRSHNLNLGLKKATGRFICFLDDDDQIYPNHLNDLVSAIQNNKTAWAIGNIDKIIKNKSEKKI